MLSLRPLIVERLIPALDRVRNAFAKVRGGGEEGKRRGGKEEGSRGGGEEVAQSNVLA